MGLDSYLFRRGKNPKARIMISLKSNQQDEEIGYWRKCWDLHEEFCSFASEELKSETPDCNCVEIPITENYLKEIIDWVETNWADSVYTIDVLNKALKETDFNNEELFYYAWF